MKKREITNNDLEHLFSNIIEQPPLINEEQVNLLLNNLPKVKPGNATKHFLKNHLNTLIIGTIVMSVFVGLSLWININHNTEKTIDQNDRVKNEAVHTSPDTVALKSVAENNKELIQNTEQKDKTTTISSNQTSSSPIQSEIELSVSDIYRHYNKKPQIFTFQANRDTSIICKEGTLIKIKPNSFISEKTGKEISGKIHLAVLEYYTISDIILSNLTTTSDNKILETGGMIHLSATADKEKCVIKEGRVIEIGFPYSKKKNDMALFNGEWTNNKIDWKLANTNTSNIEEVQTSPSLIDVVEDPVFVVVEEMPEFPGGEPALRQYINQNAKYPFSLLKNKIEGKVFITFVVDRFGYTKNIQVVNGLDIKLDKVAVYLVSKMPAWKPARQRGFPVSCRYTVPVKFSFKDTVMTDDDIRQSKLLEENIKDLEFDPTTKSYITNNKALNEEIEKRIKEGNLKGTNALDVNHYIFSVSQLGWFNCDRFDNNKNPKTNYSILIDDPNKTIVNVIFHSINAIVPGCIESDRLTFKNVPLGEMITIVAVKMVNNKLFLAVKETEITDKLETELDYKPVTMKLLRKEMEKLNKLN